MLKNSAARQIGAQRGDSQSYSRNIREIKKKVC